MKKYLLFILSLIMMISVVQVLSPKTIEAKEVGAGIQPILVHYPRPEVVEEKVVEEVKTELKQYVSKNTFTVEMNDVEEEKQEPIVEETVQEETIIEEVETEEIVEEIPEQIVEETLTETEENTTEEVKGNPIVEEVADKITDVIDKVQNIDFEAKINNLIDKIYNKVEAPLSTLYLYQHAILGGGRTLNFGQDHVVTATILKSDVIKEGLSYLLDKFVESDLESGSLSVNFLYYSNEKVKNLYVNQSSQTKFVKDGNHRLNVTFNSCDENLALSTGNLQAILEFERIDEGGKVYYRIDCHFHDTFEVMERDEDSKFAPLIDVSLYNKLSSLLDRFNIVKDYEWNAYATLKIEA